MPTLPLKSVTLCLARPSFRRSFLTSSQRSVLLCHPFVNSPLFYWFQVQNIHAQTQNLECNKQSKGDDILPPDTLNFIHVSQYTKNFNIRHIHWTVNDVTEKEPLERFRGVFTASVVAFHLENPSKAVKITRCLSRGSFPARSLTVLCV